MEQTHRPIMTGRRLLVFKWLMVFLPSATVAVGHSLLEHTGGGTHGLSTWASALPVTLLGLVLSYIFVETLFRVLRRLQTEYRRAQIRSRLAGKEYESDVQSILE